MRRILATTTEQSWQAELAMTALRVFAGASLSLAHGLGKLPPSPRFVATVDRLGFPEPELFAWAAGLSETVGGALLALGLLTRPSALFVAITMAVAAFGLHGPDPFADKEHALLFAVIALVFLVRGAGRWSLDHRIAPRT
jgi:putative oxidoreductase